MMTVAVSGATGMIGTALVTSLRAGGHTVRRLVRSSRDAQPGDIPWDPARAQLSPQALAGCTAIVHLAGAPVAQRWTPSHKREILESRVLGTSLIARAVAAMDVKPSVVLSGSAIGYYGDRAAELLDESSARGGDFLSSVVQQWEEAAAPIAESGVRLALLRSGLVLSHHGGALAKMLPPFKLGAGGKIGGGRQWMSWIALHDHVRAMEHLLFAHDVRGPVNLVAPNPVTNEDFTATLGHVLSRPAVLTVPAFALELAYGEMARATLLASQRVVPGALVSAGFAFDFPSLEPALRSALSE
ncbi:MAG: TIGR01777 family oxidoreductase [Gemmatimonadota bacterium]|nr:TIGR01777 family oxidoreductase [Gemmatimonadota bacterium]